MMSRHAQPWFVYILECADSTLYTGVSTDPERRFREHQAKQGARYTKARGAKRLLYTERCIDRRAACVREAEIKTLPRARKRALCDHTPDDA